MPRISTKTKSKNNISNVTKSCNNTDKNISKETKLSKNVNTNEKIIKKEFVTASEIEKVTEGVYHRKSERRRVARDIFLVFEEQPNSRSTRRTGRRHTKSKFGHLKVEEPIKSKALLRDIKNEPRCYLRGNNVNDINATVPGNVVPILNTNRNLLMIQNGKQSKTKNKTTAHISLNSDCSNQLNNKKNSKLLEPQAKAAFEETRIVARVNPIFLWVKQDDTRIVEVRCEDYDKRNRIRITKTSNGWRAIPRSDPTSSRVLQFYPTPLMKVKREININDANKNLINVNVCNSETKGKLSFPDEKLSPEKCVDEPDCRLNGINTVCNPLATKKVKNKKKTKKAKRKLNNEKPSKKSKINEIALEKCSYNSEFIKPNKSANVISNKQSGLEIMTFGTDCKVNHDQKLEIVLVETEIIDNNKQVADINISQNGLNLNSLNSTLETVLKTKPTYQSETEEDFGFQLCPKTGLFVPNNNSISRDYEVYSNDNVNVTINKSLISVNSQITGKSNQLQIDINEEPKLQLIEDNQESLDAKTKNLKDLLDNADLLQHCDDNANSDSDLIDSLVKTSCENNLIQSNEIISKGNLEHLQQKDLQDTSEIVVQIVGDVSNPPKCLSFNEAGEIEGLNGELFQSNAYVETFDKQTSTTFPELQNTLHSTTTAIVTSASPQITATNDTFLGNIENRDVNDSEVADEYPKDLSYKKREEVCPPSESRNQCAVTSSSDVIKSAIQDDASVFASSSETLKNIILEQFIKFNALSNQQQRDPIDLGKQRHTEMSHTKGSYTSKTNIETVVIDDDDDINTEDEQPLKKRLRLNGHNTVAPNIMSINSKSKIALNDKDPDPLTQLRLLIRNTQWKVPDPILVPKDRLSAVLASPAREIPLLITTRPELRLPEAFAYPEIIQNPNILVISMAQLEAILKNEVAMGMFSSSQDLEPDKNKQSKNGELAVLSNEPVKDFHSQASKKHASQSLNKNSNMLNTNISPIPNNILNTSLHAAPESRKADVNAKCSQTDSLSSELNAATMAVLNQLLWFPYFGHISQDIIKSVKNPLLLQEKFLNFTTLYNSNDSNSGMENVNKNTTISGQTANRITSNTALQNFTQPSNDLSIFQRIVQHQMQNIMQSNHVIKPDSVHQTNSQSKDSSELHQQSVTAVADCNINSSKSSEPKIQKLAASNKEETNFISHYKNMTSPTRILAKSYNLRSSVAGRNSSDLKQYTNQRHVADGKPRLTCKSLSNLLNPQHSALPSSANMCVSNLASDFLKNPNVINKSSHECITNYEGSIGTITASNNSLAAGFSSRPCNLTNVSIDPAREFNKQKNVGDTGNNEASSLPTDTNVPLWHPLFGSNPKSAYSSPWQWTTVTATGE